jgi:hypothetical protein
MILSEEFDVWIFDRSLFSKPVEQLRRWGGNRRDADIRLCKAHSSGLS